LDDHGSVAQGEGDRSNALAGLAVGALGPIVVALILVPFRTELDNANLALVLVFVVVTAAILGGRRAGALAAIIATLSFDFFLTRPYLSLKIETSDDLETALILLGVGLLVGAVASRGRRSERDRERAADAILRVHRVADLNARGAPVDEVVQGVTRELRELLSLADCWLEFPPFVYVMPHLERGGSIEGSEHHWFGGGVALSEDGVELTVLERGAPIARIVLIGDPERSVTIEERVVAVALADQLGVALALAGPGEQARLADETRRK
jgi:antitoxin (DNA-binding transcriptional repressor) of toxin-antitoxin stability system